MHLTRNALVLFSWHCPCILWLLFFIPASFWPLSIWSKPVCCLSCIVPHCSWPLIFPKWYLAKPQFLCTGLRLHVPLGPYVCHDEQISAFICTWSGESGRRTHYLSKHCSYAHSSVSPATSSCNTAQWNYIFWLPRFLFCWLSTPRAQMFVVMLSVLFSDSVGSTNILIRARLVTVLSLN